MNKEIGIEFPSPFGESISKLGFTYKHNLYMAFPSPFGESISKWSQTALLQHHICFRLLSENLFLNYN